jgi:hypothetical protein
MSQFITPTHMAKFGRPLWLAYSRPDHVARIKIIGGNPSRAYDAYNEHHVFAAMLVRLCIDVNLANPLSLPLMQTAVNVYMRMVDSVDPSTGIMFTTTPSEPILAYAAMQHLCIGNSWAFQL